MTKIPNVSIYSPSGSGLRNCLNSGVPTKWDAFPGGPPLTNHSQIGILLHFSPVAARRPFKRIRQANRRPEMKHQFGQLVMGSFLSLPRTNQHRVFLFVHGDKKLFVRFGAFHFIEQKLHRFEGVVVVQIAA